MLPLSLITWWYSAGWRDQAGLCGSRLSRVSDRFSITLLLKSLLAPFRQISADEPARGGLDVKVRAWLDKLISRGIGAMIRSALIISGAIMLLIEVILAGVRLAVWPFLPILPIAGIVMTLGGWIPWQI